MNINTNMNGENVTIKNVLGDVSNSSIVYIDSSDNLVVKTEPIENRSKIIGTNSYESSITLNTFDNLNGVNKKNRVWLHGSSSTSRCGTTFMLAKSTSAEFNEASNGYWFGVQSMYRSPFELALNTGIGGSVLSAHNITFSTIISSTSAEYFDIVVLQYMANDIANNIDVSAYTPIIESNIKTALQYGKKVILVVPHAKGGSSVSDADFNLRTLRYIDYRNWCYLQERRYNGLVYVADHYNVFNGGRVPELYTDDGVHLNSFGAYKVAESWSNIVKRMGLEMPNELDGYSFGGTIIKILSGTGSGISISNVSGVYIEKDLFGRSQFSAYSTNQLGNIFAGVTLTSGVYKIFVDFDHIYNFSATTQYAAGAKVTGGTPNTHRRIGINSDGKMTPGRYQLLSAPFLVTEPTISYNLHFYFGGASILRSVYLIKVS